MISPNTVVDLICVQSVESSGSQQLTVFLYSFSSPRTADWASCYVHKILNLNA